MPERMLDHLVLPVADLSVSRARLSSLGFTVAPTGAHPFGTANCCVYFSDGTFIEPLTVFDAAAANEAIRLNNMFVSRDAEFRQLAGNNGFSAMVLKTDDALADDAAFRGDGISAGEVLDFERPSRDANGQADIAAFRLAFAVDPNSPEPYFFTCQRVRSPKIDRSGLEQHRNGTVRIKGIAAQGLRPAIHTAFLSAFLGAAPAARPQGWTWALNGSELTLSKQAVGPDEGMHLTAIRFGVADLKETAGVFKAEGIAYETGNQTVIVPPAPGQGAIFTFEAME